MARPCRCRRIGRFPDYWVFSAEHSDQGKQEIVMSLDEYETIRLIDYEGMRQEECAVSMDVARTTVTAIYESARKKMAQHMIDGTPLRITGGAYRLVSDRKMNIEEKGKDNMRIAVTYENGMVGQHFGHTEQFKLYDIDNGAVVREQVISTDGRGHGLLAGVLKEAQADTLICGGIGMGARTALTEAGIALCPGVGGAADEAVQAYLSGTLAFNPDESCHHHDHEEGHECHHDHGGDHDCHHEHGCGGRCSE